MFLSYRNQSVDLLCNLLYMMGTSAVKGLTFVKEFNKLNPSFLKQMEVAKND